MEMSGLALGVFPKLVRRSSKSASQFLAEDVRKKLENSFLKALENCAGVGLSLFPPCCRVVPKKFSKGSVFNLLVKRNLISCFEVFPN